MTNAIVMEGIHMQFGKAKVLQDVRLEVAKGSIHGLIGENGAGKSTLMNVLSGLLTPTAGHIVVDGQERHWTSPSDALAGGIAMVHQHFMLAEPFTVLDNLLLVQSHTRRIPFLPLALQPLDRRRAASELRQIAESHQLPVHFSSKIEDLPVGEQQKVEILKLLYQKADILILDEPTAVLTPQEIEKFFAQLRELRAEGKTIIIITHKLREVMAITDAVTVLRAGKVAGRFQTKTTSVDELAHAMVGNDFQLPVAAAAPSSSATSVLAIKNLSVYSHRIGSPHARPLLQNINLNLRPGEIVGIAGVSGNGQDVLIDSLLHPRAYFQSNRAEGEIILENNSVKNHPHREMRMAGVAAIYPDRHRQSVCLNLDLKDNYLLGKDGNPDFVTKGWVRQQVLEQRTQASLERHHVRPNNPDALMNHLSGGNQQKMVVGRELDSNPKLLIAAEPTRGVDIGAMADIYRLFKEHQQKGAAILLISSDLEEILRLSQRIFVLYRGQLVKEWQAGHVTEYELGQYMGGKSGG